MELEKTERELQFSFVIKSSFGPPSWTMWYSPWMKLLQAQFSFCQPMMLITASASIKMPDRISCFLQDMVLSNNVNTADNKPNTSWKSKSIPFSLHGSRRGLVGFHLCLDFLCQPIAALCTGRLVVEKK